MCAPYQARRGARPCDPPCDHARQGGRRDVHEVPDYGHKARLSTQVYSSFTTMVTSDHRDHVTFLVKPYKIHGENVDFTKIGHAGVTAFWGLLYD